MPIVSGSKSGGLLIPSSSRWSKQRASRSRSTASKCTRGTALDTIAMMKPATARPRRYSSASRSTTADIRRSPSAEGEV